MKRILLSALVMPLAGGLLVPVATQAQGPDIIVSDLYDTRLWGQVGDITAYSVATESCNVGDQNALWIANTNQHPLIGQNMYRLKEGRMEQIGMSWLKHGFAAVNGSACGNCQNPGTSTVLGVGCSDPYSASLNGDQEGFNGVSGLGPRSDVNPSTGAFPFPYTAQGQGGDAIYKRLQVRTDDVDPAQNTGALYFVEGHYVTADESLPAGGANNLSYRQVRVNADLTLTFEDVTQQQKPAIQAWQDQDPSVVVTTIDVPGDGRMTLAAKVTDLGGNLWHYEYALHNTNSDRAAGGFAISVADGITVTNAGFHDVDYHSGEPYDAADWPAQLPPPGGGSMSWSTTAFTTDPDANALRWGTMYNFFFDADAPPQADVATVTLFEPGTPASVSATTLTPGFGGGAVICIAEEDFEASNGGWLNSASSTCSTGTFVLGTPTQVNNGGVTTQVAGDHTTGVGKALFTAVNLTAGNADVDGGTCILESPVFNVGLDSDVSLHYFHGQRDSGDDPGDFFRLEVSTDGGATYSPFVDVGDERTNAAWTEAVTTVLAGSAVKLRVQVADGSGPGDLIEAGIDDLSICSTGGNANNAPQVSITSPTDGSAVTVGDPVSFAGTASDAEDGDLTAGLSWTSSIDGAIGSGGSFSVSTLSVGVHTITAAVTDLEGAPGSAAITLTVSSIGGGNCSVEEDFESGSGGWTNSPTSTCTEGSFVVAIPNLATSQGVTTQPAGDHTTGSGSAFFTGTNTSAGSIDVDSGNCVAESPVYAVAQASNVSVFYFHGQRDNDDDGLGADFFLLELSIDGGATYSPIVSIGDVTTNAVWTEVTAAVPAGADVQLRVQVSDGGGFFTDLIEAGIDDVSICAF